MCSIFSLVRCACTGNDAAAVWFYMANHGVDVDAVVQSDGATPLFIACCHGSLKVVRLLLKKGSKIHKSLSKDDGWTPLFIASCNGHVEVVRLLVEKGAAINKATKMGDTPLSVALNQGHAEIVALLEQAGASR